MLWDVRDVVCVPYQAQVDHAFFVQSLFVLSLLRLAFGFACRCLAQALLASHCLKSGV